MTNEKRYENIVKMLYDYDRRTGERAADLVLARPEDFLKCPFSEFYACAAALIIEARAGIDKKQTPATVTAAVKRIMKTTPEGKSGIAHYTSGYAVITKYSVIRLHNDLTALPHLDENEKYPETTLNKIMNGTIDAAAAEPLPLPTIPELKAYIARCKAIGGKEHHLAVKVGNIYFNPAFLLDFMEALPGCVAYAPKSSIAPVYFKSENGDAVLLPVNPKVAKVAFG